MKKIVRSIVVLILCLTVLWGCTQKEPETKPGEFCRVLCLKDDGFVVEIPDTNLGYVYVKHADATLEIKPLDTVVIEFSESDLQTADEAFVDFFGQTHRYSYILETPKSIRLADTEAGEPTFG